MKRLLIVDDELGSRESLKAIFSREYSVSAVSGAEEALGKLASQPFDVMLVDVMMPGRDGVSLLMEAQGLYTELPCIMVSASSSLRPVVDAIKAGAVDYIAKPYDVAEIRRIVARHSAYRGRGHFAQSNGTMPCSVNCQIDASAAP